MTADQVAAKTNRLKRGEVPSAAIMLTMFVDVQAPLLFYAVTAWEDDFTGSLLTTGRIRSRSGPTSRPGTPGRRSPVAKGAGLEGAIYAGLESLTGEYLGREWRRDDGAAMRIERCLVDANWGLSTDVVYQFCRQSAHSALLMPSHGRFVGASSIPFSEYQRKMGDRVGHNWRIPNVQGRRQVGTWSSTRTTGSRLSTPGWRWRWAIGAVCRCLATSPTASAVCRALTAEYRVKTEGRGRTVDEWKMRPERSDNHWLDCLVGCAVAASMQGVVLPGTDVKPVIASAAGETYPTYNGRGGKW